MKATPQFRADPEEYPELSTLVNAVIRNVVTIMEAHDIGAVRRFHKDGVFDRPYTKDVVTPLGVPGVPRTVQAVREAAGKAVLDYLEAIGITGLSLEATAEEKANVSAIWNPPKPSVPAQAPVMVKDPVPVKAAISKPTKPDKPKKETTQKNETKKGVASGR